MNSLGHGLRLFRPAIVSRERPGIVSCERPGTIQGAAAAGEAETASSGISGQQLSSGVVVCVSSPESQCEAFRAESAVCARSPVSTDVAAPHHSEEVQRQPAFDMIIILIPFQDDLLSADHAQCGSRCHEVVDRVKPSP